MPLLMLKEHNNKILSLNFTNNGKKSMLDASSLNFFHLSPLERG